MMRPPPAWHETELGWGRPPGPEDVAKIARLRAFGRARRHSDERHRLNDRLARLDDRSPEARRHPAAEAGQSWILPLAAL